jgi:arginyl-tRNA synthetase
VTEVTIAGAGFVNWRLGDDFWRARVGDILAAGLDYGRSSAGAGRGVNVEFVSANPTGPMHVGHARGAVFGDALARLLEKAGFRVCREYYINDAGGQVDVLARSTHLRYREALGEDIGDIPEGLYPGDYLKEAGEALAARDGGKWLGAPESEWLEPLRDFAIDAMMAMIKTDLAALGVSHDVFSSERSLHRSGAVDRALATLEAEGLLYVGVLEPPKGKTPDDWEPRPQTLFRATQFGDDVDRPLRKSDGSWTYFAADIAYHLDKFLRGSPELIDVLGADHGGYVKRMTAAVTAITGAKGALDVKICQLVQLYDDGKPFKMSKRAGTFVTLRDVVDEVGKDIVRFMMLTRRNDQTIDFDFKKVVEQSRDNMVWYVQYAHARAQSVLRRARSEDTVSDLTAAALAAADLSPLVDSSELALIRLLAGWPRLIESAAEAHEPHRVAFYLYEIASQFHSLWNKGKEDAGLRFVLADDAKTTLARLALVEAVGFVIASGLGVFGVTPVMELR